MKMDLVRKHMKKLILPATALGLLVSVSTQTAMAYFTTYTSAGGRAQVSLGFTKTETEDTVSDWTKHIAIENSGEQECYARVKVLVGERYQNSLTYTSEEGGWTLNTADGYWYYSKILEPQKKTEELLVKLDRAGLSEMTPAGEQEIFNVIVVPEYTAVLYDKEGNPYADWELYAAEEVE